MKNVLIACEESQTVCTEFRNLGFNAYSCDILGCSGGHPEWHFKCDVFNVVNNRGGITESGENVSVNKWDLMIAHPPCTFLTVTGNRWFNIERYGDKAIKRHKDRRDAIDFFINLYNSDIDHIAIENPVGVISTSFKKPCQIIQPYQFGDNARKTTCIWTKGLPLLTPTNIVDEGEIVYFESGKSMPKWYADAFSLPKGERSKIRSKTFKGIAEAMASQWGDFILNK